MMIPVMMKRTPRPPSINVRTVKPEPPPPFEPVADGVAVAVGDDVGVTVVVGAVTVSMPSCSKCRLGLLVARTLTAYALGVAVDGIVKVIEKCP